jgi:hypothetical protein
MTDLQIYALQFNEDLSKIVTVAVAKAAQYCLAGGSTNPVVLATAKQAATNPMNFKGPFLWYAILNGDVQINPTDQTAIEYVVNLKYPEIWGA